MFSEIVVAKRTGSWFTTPIWRRSQFTLISRNSLPSIVTWNKIFRYSICSSYSIPAHSSHFIPQILSHSISLHPIPILTIPFNPIPFHLIPIISNPFYSIPSYSNSFHSILFQPFHPILFYFISTHPILSPSIPFHPSYPPHPIFSKILNEHNSAYHSSLRVIKSLHQRNNRAFSTTAFPNKSNLFSFRYSESKSLQNLKKNVLNLSEFI